MDDDFFSGIELTDVSGAKRMVVIGLNGRPTHYENEGGRSEEVYIDLHSSDSDIARKHNRAVQKRLLDLSARGQRLRRTPEEIEAETTDLLVALTAGWNFRRGNGEPIPFSSDNARRLYDNPGARHIRDQVDEFVSNRANFLQPSSRS
jgi:hypothetical protein